MRCVSFCPTENYKLAPLSNYFKNKGYYVKQFRKVLHITHPIKDGDIFIFAYGCLVTWGLKKKDEDTLLEQLKPFSINLLPNLETAHFIFRYDNYTEMATHERFNVDIIVLESDSDQLKLAISYGLAQSIQLESYESAVEKTIEKNSSLSEQLAKHGKINLSQKALTQRMGQIFLARSSINLNSEYLAAPEYFWEHPSLADYYSMSKKFLDIPGRVSALNQKLDVLHELLQVLNSQLQHQHASMLEVVIIALILIEIIISIATLFHLPFFDIK